MTPRGPDRARAKPRSARQTTPDVDLRASRGSARTGGRLRLTPAQYRRITGLALLALCCIIVTGAAVRLTGSGLGCPEWPNCEAGSLVPRGETGHHGWVEFVNRAITGIVSVAVALAVLGSRWRVPRRRDLTLLSIGLVVGVAAQVVLGGLTVLFHLTPPIVMAHFLVSLVLVANAVVLHARADGRRAHPPSAAQLRSVARWLVAAASVVVVTGTVVTGAGPHGGDEDVERLAVDVADAARVHGVAVVVLVGLTLVAAWLARRTAAPTDVTSRIATLLAVEVAQAVVGYVQYFTGVPELLVAIHVAGAVGLWIAVLCVFVAVGGTAGSVVASPDRVRASL